MPAAQAATPWPLKRTSESPPPGRYARLCVLPPNTPAPASMLAKLWQAEAAEVKASLAALAAKGVLNVAQLPDGRVWCLPQAQQLELLQAACRDVAPRYHRLLLDAYCAATLPSILEEGPEQQQQQQEEGQEGGQLEDGCQQQQQQQYHWQPPPPGSQQQQQGQLLPQRPSRGHSASSAARLLQHAPQRLQSIPDDGYILINLGHHLTAGGRHQQVRRGVASLAGGGGVASLPHWLRRTLSAAAAPAGRRRLPHRLAQPSFLLRLCVSNQSNAWTAWMLNQTRPSLHLNPTCRCFDATPMPARLPRVAAAPRAAAGPRLAAAQAGGGRHHRSGGRLQEASAWPGLWGCRAAAAGRAQKNCVGRQRPPSHPPDCCPCAARTLAPAASAWPALVLCPALVTRPSSPFLSQLSQCGTAGTFSWTTAPT